MAILNDLPLVGIDTETGGIDPKAHELYEIAVRYIDLSFDRALGSLEILIKNTAPVPPEASAIHHLTETHLQAGMTREKLASLLPRLIPNPGVIFAHNAPFDRSFLPELDDRKWLCTKRLAMHVWPDAPSYSNQALRYWLGGEDWLSPEENARVHRASMDILVTEHILREALDELWATLCTGRYTNTPEMQELYAKSLGQDGLDVDALLAYIESPVLITKWNFGQYYGKPIVHAPPDYLKWVLSTDRARDDRDLRYTCETVLAQKEGAGVP